MSRIRYPKHFLRQERLARAIVKKHGEEGSRSILLPFLKFKAMTLDHWEPILDEANSGLDAYHTLYAQAKQARIDRDRLFFPLLSSYRKCVQMLRVLCDADRGYMAQWGISFTGDKIMLSGTFEGRFEAMEQLYLKHISLKEESPLVSYMEINNINPADELEKLHICRQLHSDVATFHKAAEGKYGQFCALRDTLMGEIRMVGRYLMRCFSDQPHRAKDWGLAVSCRVKQTKEIEREREIAAEQTITISSCAIGSAVQNTGTVPLVLRTGKTKRKKPRIIQPGARIAIMQGESTIRVTNTSDESSGRLKVVVRR